MLVSIIMPAYNAGKYIAASITSVLSQTYGNWELIVIDDGSTDNTKEEVTPFVEKDTRIRYLFQQNGKQGKARNNGIKHSNGEYIAFLDADDLWLPHKLELQVELLHRNNVDLVFSGSYVFSERFDIAKADMLLSDIGYFEGLSGVKSFLERNRIPLLTVLCKKSILENVCYFSEKQDIQNAEDYHLWLKLQFAGYRFLGIHEPLAAYREVFSSSSGKDRLNIKQVIESQFDLLNKSPEHKSLIFPFLKSKIKYSLFRSGDYPDKAFYSLVQRHITMCDITYLLPLFKLMKLLNLRSLSLRSAYFVFNYIA